jgi:hypothetical protein
MKIDKEETVKITMHLTEEEARWLVAAMQNPLNYSEHPEGIRNTNMRTAFYECLRGALA